MPTLYEILKEKVQEAFGEKKSPSKEEFFNPLGAMKKNSLTLDVLDYRGKTFFVEDIQEIKVEVEGKTFRYTDYVLHSNPYKGDPISVRLRVVPVKDSDLPYRAIVLSLYDDLAYNEGLHGVVKDTTKKFVVDDAKENIHEEYWRINDVGVSYKADVIAQPSFTNGPTPALLKKIEFWDYSRTTKLDGVDFEQFLFVEMNAENGWFQLWRGFEINPEQVVLM